MAKTSQQIKKALTSDAPRVPPIPDDSWLSLGCTLLNLAVAGRPDGGAAMGQYVWFVGDSSSGKTWFAFQALAEAARNSAFDRHRFIYDNAENGALFEVGRYFGDAVQDRLEPPAGTAKAPKNSAVVEDFYYNVDDAIKDGRPFIYVLDSMDALDAEADEAKFQKQKASARDAEEEEAKGTYGMAKAKANSTNIKRVVSALPDTGSMLFVLSQTRDKVSRLPFPQKTSAGGRALKFYSHVELWTNVAGDLTRGVLGKTREYGKLIGVDVRKNRISGWEGKVVVPFLRGYGFDDVGASVDYLCDEKYWARDNKSGTVTADDFKFKGRREDLIKLIQEKDGGEQKLANLAAFLWRRIDEAVRIKRKPRYE